MVGLLSHSLPNRLGLPADVVREAYRDVRQLLDHDFHYWLQRASYEIEKGSLNVAANYLHAAQGCEGGHDDFKVATAFGTVVLRQATANPGDSTLGERALVIYEQLWSIVRRKRGESPHTFVTLIQDGYEWIRVSRTISNEKRREIRLSLLEAVKLAERHCARNPQCMAVVANYRAKLEWFDGTISGVPL